MFYTSTRASGKNERAGFLEALLAGPAPDGGLYVPEQWPLAPDMPSTGSYEEMAARILHFFAGQDLTFPDCQTLCAEAYASFSDPAITPLKQLDERLYLLELFHGPTFAFKDIALQMLARLFDRATEKRGGQLTLIGATSGDTGSAAIEACRVCRAVEIFILYPDGRPSEIQRRQMTTIDAPNVHALAVEGSFDDCQNLVKALFADKILTAQKQVSAVNSINWARIVMQSVYYARAAQRLPGADFIVPSGNFGNIYAGYVAKRLGFAVGRLIAATNVNDALHQFFTTGQLARRETLPTLSPSMDIQIPSNLERYLFEALDRDPARTKNVMRDAAQGWTMDREALTATQRVFASGMADDTATLRAMKDFHLRYGEMIDPHTGVGAAVLAQRPQKKDGVSVLLATAHPAKFPEAVERATGAKPEAPERLAALTQGREKITKLPADLDVLRTHILSC